MSCNKCYGLGVGGRWVYMTTAHLRTQPRARMMSGEVAPDGPPTVEYIRNWVWVEPKPRASWWRRLLSLITPSPNKERE